MTDTPRKPLSEAFAGLIAMLIAMIPGLIRARGLRGLLELPAQIRFALQLRRMCKEFTALLSAFAAGTLPPIPPAPAPESWTAPPVASAPPPAAASRAVRARAPARAARPDASLCEAEAASLQRSQARATMVRIPHQSRRMPAAIAPRRALPPPFDLFPEPVPRKNRLQAIRPSHANFVTI
jgi:hypothetical protein